jgi:FG-GAP-like repeat
MKKYLLLATLFSASLLSFGLENQPGRYTQFGLDRSHLSHKASHKVITHHGVSFTQPSARCAVASETHANPEVAGKGHFAKAAANLGNGSNNNASTVSFVAAVDTPMGGTDDGETEAVMGDFNGDGKMDIAKIVTNTVCDSEITQLSVALGNGDGTFQAAQLTTLPADTDGPILVADLNGDNNDDLLLTEGRDFFVLLSNGDGTFTVGNSGSPYPITATQFVLGGLLTDVDGDGKLDVLAIDNATPANVIELLGNGDGTFHAATTLGHLTTSAPNNMFFADFNGDGKIDFVGQLESGQLQVTLATGSGVFANAPVSLVTSDAQYHACFSTDGDLNGDSKPEIVSVNCNQNTVTVYVNTGTGTFGTGLYYDANFNDNNFPSEATIADINGDGKNDIVVSDSESGTISVFLGHGDGTVTAEPLAYDTGQFPWTAPLVADFNGDGLMDVLIPDDAFSFVYLQGFGDGTFRAAPSYPLPDTFVANAASFSVATGDFNNDGIPDVVVGAQGNTGAAGMVVYLGKGDGTFLPGVNYGAQTDASFLAVADFNGDGIPDVAVADSQPEQSRSFWATATEPSTRVQPTRPTPLRILSRRSSQPGTSTRMARSIWLSRTPMPVRLTCFWGMATEPSGTSPAIPSPDSLHSR